MGSPDPRRDVERRAAVREAGGPGYRLMVDANQGPTLADARALARAIEPSAISWLEEPVPADDVSAHARLVEATSIPIAVGESLYSVGQFKEYLARDAATIVQPDVARVGGITPWLKIAHLAEAFNVPVCPHFLVELHVSLVAAVPNGRVVEYIPQLRAVTTADLVTTDERATASDVPGIGTSWVVRPDQGSSSDPAELTFLGSTPRQGTSVFVRRTQRSVPSSDRMATPSTTSGIARAKQMNFNEAFRTVVCARGRRASWHVAQFLDAWGGFVEAVESGYPGDLYEYEDELSVRDDVERAMSSHELPPYPGWAEFHERLIELDNRLISILAVGPQVRPGSPWWRARLPKYGGPELAEDAARLFGATVEVV